MTDQLRRYGFTEMRQGQFAGFCQFTGVEAEPGRVIGIDRGAASVITASGVRLVAIEPNRGEDDWPPVVGDWVGLSDTSIAFILPRQTYLQRPASTPGAASQALAANVSAVLIIDPLPHFSAGRIERMTALARQSGIEAWLVATKADLVDAGEVDVAIAGVAAVVDRVFVTRLDDPATFTPLRAALADSGTAVVFGRSGAGKSTLINQLVGADLATRQVRQSDGKGRHTTTRRTLLASEQICIIDSPGIREIAAPADREAIDAVFREIQRLAGQCRFRNCAHRSEPGCAVQEAISQGSFDAGQLARYQRMVREAKRRDPGQVRVQRQAERRSTKNARRAKRYLMERKNRAN